MDQNSLRMAAVSGSRVAFARNVYQSQAPADCPLCEYLDSLTQEEITKLKAEFLVEQEQQYAIYFDNVGAGGGVEVVDGPFDSEEVAEKEAKEQELDVTGKSPYFIGEYPPPEEEQDHKPGTREKPKPVEPASYAREVPSWGKKKKPYQQAWRSITGEAEGEFTKCMDWAKGKGFDDPGAFCQWMKMGKVGTLQKK